MSALLFGVVAAGLKNAARWQIARIRGRRFEQNSVSSPMAAIFFGCLVQFAHFWSTIVLSSARGAHRSKTGLRKRPISDPFRPPFLQLSRETSSHLECKAPSRIEKLALLPKSENGALARAGTLPRTPGQTINAISESSPRSSFLRSRSAPKGKRLRK